MWLVLLGDGGRVGGGDVIGKWGGFAGWFWRGRWYCGVREGMGLLVLTRVKPLTLRCIKKGGDFACLLGLGCWIRMRWVCVCIWIGFGY